MKRVSIILIDWSVRENFYVIEYFNKQTIPRQQFEIIWVEYYDRKPKEIENYYNKGYIDKWFVLNKSGAYFKHHLFNKGIVESEGDIIVIPDSDALVRPTFMESILDTFDKFGNENIVLYLDEIRSSNKAFYPFKLEYSWDYIMESPGLINWDEDKHTTKGLATNYDILHSRNYGGCFCAERKAIIDAGGFDEHSSHHCFICGVYELGFRLVNKGYKEIWHEKELLLHVWHPWVDPKNDIIGHHDGLMMSSTAMEILKSKRTFPLLENEDIRKMRVEGVSNRTFNYGEEVFYTPYNKIQRYNLLLRLHMFLSDCYRRLLFYSTFIFTKSKFKSMLIITPYDLPYADVTNYKNYGIKEKAITGNSLYNAFRYVGKVNQIRLFNYDIIYRTFGHSNMETKLLDECRMIEPDLVIYIPLKYDKNVLGNERVEPDVEILKKIKKDFGTKLYLYMNKQMLFSNVQQADIFDYFILNSSQNPFENKIDSTKILYGYPPIDFSTFYKRDYGKDIDVCFWGSVTPGSIREEYIEFLRKNDIKVFTRLHRLSYPEYAEVLRRSKIALSIRGEMEEENNLRQRSFEILASGALLVDDSLANTKSEFVSGKDYIEFKDKTDLLEKIRFYLADEKQRRKISKSGYMRLKKSYNAVKVFNYLFNRSIKNEFNIVYDLLKIANLGFINKLVNRISVYKQLLHVISKKPKKVAIFGASISGEESFELCNKIGFKVLFFIDNMAFLQREEYLGCRVYPVEYVVRSGKDSIDAIILASLGRKKEMRNQLKDLKFNKPAYDFETLKQLIR